jgi:hypothetical protein
MDFDFITAKKKASVFSLGSVVLTLGMSATLLGCSTTAPTALQDLGKDPTVSALSDSDITVAPQGEPGYQITVGFTSTVTTSQRQVFEAAAARWSEVITGDLPDVDISNRKPEVGVIDDLYIEASIVPIDGPGRILGQAGPQLIRSGGGLPIFGIMQFDSADVAMLESEGQFEEVILHEMGHVTGIGTLWSRSRLLRGIVRPRFIGRQATNAYQDACDRSARNVPVENDGGPGTARGHWEEDILDNELMTGFLNAGVSNPLSAITVGSLADLGYRVNTRAADPYTCPEAGESGITRVLGQLKALEFDLIEVD